MSGPITDRSDATVQKYPRRYAFHQLFKFFANSSDN